MIADFPEDVQLALSAIETLAAEDAVIEERFLGDVRSAVGIVDALAEIDRTSDPARAIRTMNQLAHADRVHADGHEKLAAARARAAEIAERRARGEI